MYSLDSLRLILSPRLRSCVNISHTLQFYAAFAYNFQLQRACMYTFSIIRRHGCLRNFIASWTRLKNPNRNSFRSRDTTRTLRLRAFKFPTRAQTFRSPLIAVIKYPRYFVFLSFFYTFSLICSLNDSVKFEVLSSPLTLEIGDPFDPPALGFRINQFCDKRARHSARNAQPCVFDAL